MLKRLLSGILAIVYLVASYAGGGGSGAIKCALFLLLPLACIWFSEEMGSFTGVMRGQYINTRTPGCLVAFGGWLILLLPVIVGIVQQLSGK